MQNLSDKELDELIKKANESQSYPYDGDSWTALADKLDNTPKRGFVLRQTPLLSIILGVVLLSSLYYVVSKQTLASDNVTASMVPEKKQEGKQVTATDKAKQIPANGADEKVLVEVEANSSADEKGSLKVASQVERQETSADFKPSNSQVNMSAVLFDESLQQDEVESNVSYVEEQRASPASPKREHSNSMAEVTIVDSTGVEKVAVVETKNGINVKDSVETAEDEEARNNRFAIKLSVSPDFSSESFSQPDAVGWNYGAAVEYQISKAFAVSVGLLNTRKYYTAEDVTYGQYTAEYAEGDCRMWDIPMNVLYYIPSRQSLQLIGSVGFSSYIMRQENYTYYPDETNKYRKYQSEINNENSEWFKVLNLSVAAQLKVSPTVYVQLEPFIKAPLTGLGEGNISLSSFGTFFTVKYQFNTKTTPNNVSKN
jgi:hypothetical protein